MADMDKDDAFLDDFFRAARVAGPAPSQALMARILADAEAEAPRVRDLQPVAVRQPDSAGLFTWIASALGGWRGLGGLATATVTGLWFGYSGFADPATLSGGLFNSRDASATVELMPEAELFALATGGEG